MKSYSIKLIAIFFLFTSFIKPGSKKIMLAIFAHPDDELAIAPALSKLSKEYTIYVVYATDGKGGTRVNNIPPDSLGKIRMAEVTCSLQNLGLEPPIFLHVDRLDSKYDLSKFWSQTKVAKDSLKSIIKRLNPNVIITIGPDGDTGHPEHRVISSLTTELILREAWVDRYPLYFFIWTKKQADRYATLGMDDLMYADDQYINLSVKYTEVDEAKAWEAMKCHKSQYTLKEIEESIQMDKTDSLNVLHFRKFIVDKQKRKSF
jgi:LmbE family N-acetylglucosaminyl deacetylase